MDLASAPVRPGFVLIWIAAVTASTFLLLPLICPAGPVEAATAQPSDTLADTPSLPATPTLHPAPFAPDFLQPTPVSRSKAAYHEVVQAGEGTDEELPLEESEVEASATPLATATLAPRKESRSPALQQLQMPLQSQVLPAGVIFHPVALNWSLGASEDEESTLELQVQRAGRGLYLLRLLYARYAALGLDQLPEELLEALPERVLEQLSAADRDQDQGSMDSRRGGDSGLRDAWKQLGGQKRQQVRAHSRELLLLLDEQELRKLRRLLLRSHQEG